MLVIYKLRWLVTIIGLVSITIALPTVVETQSETTTETVEQISIFEADTVKVLDLSGNHIGEGQYSGEQRCINDHCFKKAQLHLNQPLADTIVIEYRFETRLALDIDAGRVVVAGTGTLFSRNQKERFLFTATIEDNGNGTLSVIYDASRVEGKLKIPNAPGIFEITSRP